VGTKMGQKSSKKELFRFLRIEIVKLQKKLREMAANKVAKNEMISTSEMGVRKIVGGSLSASAVFALALDASPGLVSVLMGAGVMLIQMGINSQ
jgi:hypothetical protein